jgi:predicted DNA-binding transcriptional regulator YafY
MLKYLLENTDHEHYVRTSDIIEHLNKEYSIPVERKTVCTDIKLLQDYGSEIGIEIDYDASAKGYKVYQREFELDELQLLIDSVQSSKFITDR